MSFLASLAGPLLGGIGSLLGAQSQNRAQNNQLDAQQRNITQSQNRTGYSLFGPQGYGDFSAATGPNANTPAGMAAASRFWGQYPGIYGGLQQAGGQLNSDLFANSQQQGRNSRGIDSMRAGAENAVAAFGNQGEDRIARQSQQALLGANQQAQASLGGLGLNTLVANQQGQNATRINQSAQDATTNLRQAQLDRFLQARNQRATSLFARRGAEESTRDAMARTRYQTTRDPMDVQLQVLGGQAYQPITPLMGGGQSGAGSALASLSGPLSVFGGMNAAQGDPYGLDGMWNRGPFGPRGY